MSLKVLENSQENNCVRVSFLITLQDWSTQLYIKGGSDTGVFLWIFARNTYFIEHHRKTASEFEVSSKMQQFLLSFYSDITEQLTDWPTEVTLWKGNVKIWIRLCNKYWRQIKIATVVFWFFRFEVFFIVWISDKDKQDLFRSLSWIFNFLSMSIRTARKTG